MSLLLSVAFDHFVIDGYLGGQGLDVLDTSSIAFEFELALFGVVTFWISTFFKRYQIKRSRVRSYVIPSYVVPSYSVFNYSSIDMAKPGYSHTSVNMVIFYLSVFRMISC